MFAALTIEREPLLLTWSTLPAVLVGWVQSFGGLAAAGLFLVLLSRALGPRGPADRGGGFGKSLTGLILVLAGVSAAGYVLLGLLHLPDLLATLRGAEAPPPPTGWRAAAVFWLWTVAGASALVAVLLPVLADLGRLSPRRILALARLSFKEAVRRKILWVFLALLLVVLFGSWFIPHRYEDQVRNYVKVVFAAQALLLLVAAALLASFGIPDDIRHQTVHTVLTKPVERFEIYLGRFLGYLALMTLVLAVTTGLSLLYVLRGVDPDAAAESLKAREPLYGTLRFEGTGDTAKGENVGREWEYRTYIFGPSPNQPTQYAIWEFRDLPAGLLAQLGERDKVRCEFSLDIYRTTKGVEGQGVYCTFQAETAAFDPDNPKVKLEYDAARREGRGDPKLDDRLAEQFGYFEVPSKEIKDYTTQYIDLPGGLFRSARKAAAAPSSDPSRPAPAPVQVRVRCDSRTQFVGMAKYDLFLRLDDPERGNDTVRFCVNFMRGSLGLWMWLALVIALAVALSTYLSGVITLLTTGVLFVLGFFQDFIQDVALRRNIGGGPVEAALRLLRRPGGESMTVPLEETTGVKVSTGLDAVFSWTLRRVLEIIPDVNVFSFTDFVAEGVAVSQSQLLAAAVKLLLWYVLPWSVLAYYLLKWREVASSN